MAYADNGMSLSDGRSLYKSGLAAPSIRRLEDEIHHLRTVMEQTYLQEAAFTSDIVIEISRKLDIKINEYMKYRRTC